MCIECGYYRCPSNCPNASSPAPYCKCEICGKDIYEGDEYYEIDGHAYCEDCIWNSSKIAGEDDDY